MTKGDGAVVVYELDLSPYDYVTPGSKAVQRVHPCFLLANSLTSNERRLNAVGLLNRRATVGKLLAAACAQKYTVVLAEHEMVFIREVCEAALGWDGALMELAARLVGAQPKAVEVTPT